MSNGQTLNVKLSAGIVDEKPIQISMISKEILDLPMEKKDLNNDLLQIQSQTYDRRLHTDMSNSIYEGSQGPQQKGKTSPFKSSQQSKYMGGQSESILAHKKIFSGESSQIQNKGAFLSRLTKDMNSSQQLEEIPFIPTPGGGRKIFNQMSIFSQTSKSPF